MNEFRENQPMKKSNKRRHGIGFFVAIALFATVIGGAAWTAVSSIRSISKPSAESAVSRSEKVEAQTVVSGVPASSAISSRKPYSRASSAAESVASAKTESTVSSKAESVPKPPESKVSSAQTASVRTVTPKNVTFALPVAGGVLKPYGENEYSETFGDWRAHTGVDLSANSGSRVISIGDGTVLSFETDDLLGNVLTVDYGSGLTASYYGLEDAVPVKVGDAVRCGQTIGTVGEIPGECADEPHLHLEIRKNGVLTEPMAAIGHADKNK